MNISINNNIQVLTISLSFDSVYNWSYIFNNSIFKK